MRKVVTTDEEGDHSNLMAEMRVESLLHPGIAIACATHTYIISTNEKACVELVSCVRGKRSHRPMPSKSVANFAGFLQFA